MELVKTLYSDIKPPIKILVVDDREDNLFSIETILERDGYTIVKAASGRAALKVLLQQQDFVLILMDVQMPGMSGFETAELIYEREKLRHIPIIFITAHSSDEENIYKGYRTGGVDYIYKPINPELLRVKVGVFVELSNKTYQLMAHERKLLFANKNLEKEIEERKASEEKVRLLNEQLTQNNEHLKAINEELDRFAYVASHDLQEPLRKIMMFSDKLQTKFKGGIDSEVDKCLQKITRETQRMQLLINDLLRFSRHSVTSDDFELVDLNLLVPEVLQEFDNELEKAKAKVNIGSLPAIWAIRSLLQQLFVNLISNALKFRKSNCAPEITITAEDAVCEPAYGSANDPEGNYVYCKIYISDNGIGFDQKYAEDVFAVFKRLHSYQEIEGTGIGLAICKKIVEKHSGFISANSKVNEGTTFTIMLPAKQKEGLLVNQ